MKRAILSLGLVAGFSLQPSAFSNPALGAGACAIPGVGWVSCSVVAAAGTGAILVILANGRQVRIPRNAFNPSGNYQRHSVPQVRPGPRPMRIDDPDERSAEYSDYVWALDDADAQRKCRQMVRSFGGRNARVRKTNSWTNKAGKARYTCYWTGAA